MSALGPQMVSRLIGMVADRIGVHPTAILRSGADLPLGFTWRGSLVTFATSKRGLALQTKGLVNGVIRPACSDGDSLHDLADKTDSALKRHFEEA